MGVEEREIGLLHIVVGNCGIQLVYVMFYFIFV